MTATDFAFSVLADIDQARFHLGVVEIGPVGTEEVGVCVPVGGHQIAEGGNVLAGQERGPVEERSPHAHDGEDMVLFDQVPGLDGVVAGAAAVVSLVLQVDLAAVDASLGVHRVEIGLDAVHDLAELSGQRARRRGQAPHDDRVLGHTGRRRGNRARRRGGRSGRNGPAGHSDHQQRRCHSQAPAAQSHVVPPVRFRWRSL